MCLTPAGSEQLGALLEPLCPAAQTDSRGKVHSAIPSAGKATIRMDLIAGKIVQRISLKTVITVPNRMPTAEVLVKSTKSMDQKSGDPSGTLSAKKATIMSVAVSALQTARLT